MKQFLRRATTRLSIGGAATLIMSVTLVGQALGFLRVRLISANFSVVDAGLSDAFFAAFQIPDFFYYTISAGALGVAFIPFLSDRLEVGDRKGVWELANGLLNVLAIIMSVVGAIIFVFAEPLMRVLAPNLPSDHFYEAVTIMRLIAVNPLLFTLSGIITSTQQVFGRFFFYAIAPLIYNLSIIVSIFLFKDSLGIIGLGVGALIGGILQLGVSIIGMVGLGYRYAPKINWQSLRFRSMLRQLPPRSLDQGIDQVNSIVEVNRAQALGTGPISWYNYALTLMNVPVMLLGNAISIAAFPRLTERLSQRRPDLFRRDFLRILSIMIWVSLPVIVISYFARAYLARLIYGAAAPQVALIFGFLSAAIFFRIIYTLISRYFYAHKDSMTPLIVSIFAIALNIYLAFTLARSSAYGISGLAIAQSIVAAVEVVILCIIIIIRDRRFFTAHFVDVLTRMLSATGFSVVVAYLMIQFIPLEVDDRGFVTLLSKLIAISGVTVSVYLGVSFLLGLEEPRPVLRKIKNVILKPVRIQ